jgi:hypothetical protein
MMTFYLLSRDLFLTYGNKSLVRSRECKFVDIKAKDEKILELYNLRNDLEEQSDLHPDNIDLTKSLHSKLKKWEMEVRDGWGIFRDKLLTLG